jgi:hypothetical protein
MAESDERPGKIRTWWHPLLASLLRWQLADHYELQEEVPVGRKPLQIDLLLLRREKGDLPESARRLLAGLAERLNALTLLEFKSPSDTLRAGDFQTCLAYALLYRAQNHPLLDPTRLTLLVLAPRLTKPYVEEMAVLGVNAVRKEEGVWRLDGGALAGHPAWVLETTTLAGTDHPVVTLVSQRLLYQGSRTYDEMQEAGYRDVAVYVLQQIQQFQRQGKEFAMQHLGAPTEMDQIMLELAQGWSAEFLDKVLPVEKRLKGLTLEQRLTGLTPEEREKLRDLLNQQAARDAGEPK